MADDDGLAFDPKAAARVIAAQLSLAEPRVSGALELLLAGNSVPFIARYRKERTGGLDDAELRFVERALDAEQALVARKDTVLRSIAEQGALDAELRSRILAARDRVTLEDLYLPFRPKRKTRASQARERGLEPLAKRLLTERSSSASRAEIVAPFIAPERGVPDAGAALAGAGDILAEQWAETPEHRAWLRVELERGALRSRKKRGYSGADDRFEGYYDFQEPIARVAPHRFLALCRGELEGVLSIGIASDDERLASALVRRLVTSPGLTFRAELEHAARDAYERLLRPSIEKDVFAALRERAERDAIQVFARNLQDLLLAPPAGPRVVAGLDPGLRTGCKVAVVDATGRVLEHQTIYPTPPRSDTAGARAALLPVLRRHRVELVAIGNGTGSREADAFVGTLLAELPGVQKVLVSEAGASVYSASELASHELPELDVTLRGAVSIARRLQDPLAELVKIEPRAIGVGQYQHDLDEAGLRRALAGVVESSVNQVGVDLNTASPALLGHVAGIGPRLAEAVVREREAKGPFATRAALRSVPRFGAKAFEQSAGFLRVRGGPEPLDASAVHPESYPVVARMARSLGLEPRALVGDPQAVGRLRAQDFVAANTGLPTVEDILAELARPGRDPRLEFRIARFAEGVSSLEDLRPGMQLEGVVTNVTRFGAFVDIGVHQDGLVHISELDTRYVKDPSAVVKVGEVVSVTVLEVDARRRRIALSRKRAQGAGT